jgi:tetratricopeptide (TPR) repeat protein
MAIRKSRLLTLSLATCLVVGLFVFLWLENRNAKSLWQWHFSEIERAYRLERFEDTIAHLEFCAAAKPADLNVRLLALAVGRRLGTFDRLKSILFEWKQNYPEQDPERFQIETLLFRAVAGEFDIVEPALLELAKSNDSSTPVVCETLARIYIKDLKLPQARWTLDRWILADPKDPAPYDFLAWTLDQMDQTGLVEDNYLASLELEPQRAFTKIRYSEYLINNNFFEKAERVTRELIRDFPDEPRAMLSRARVLMTEGQSYAEAKSLFQNIDKSGFNDVKYLTIYGQFEYESRNYLESEQLLQRAVKIDPYDPTALFALATCLSKIEGRKDEAQKLLEKKSQIESDGRRFKDIIKKELPQKPNSKELMLELGTLLERLGKSDQALRWLNKAIDIDREFLPAHVALRDIYLQKGDSTKADSHTRAIARMSKK